MMELSKVGEDPSDRALLRAPGKQFRLLLFLAEVCSGGPAARIVLCIVMELQLCMPEAWIRLRNIANEGRSVRSGVRAYCNFMAWRKIARMRPFWDRGLIHPGNGMKPDWPQKLRRFRVSR
jgi:hypothetical protein